MSKRVPSRVVAAVVFSGLFALYVYSDYTRWAKAGFDQFITYQSTRFYHYMSPVNVSFVIVGFVEIIAILAMYEGLAAFIDWAIDRLMPRAEVGAPPV